MAPPKGTKVDRAVVRRAWAFGAPFRGHIYGYLFLVAVTSALGVVPALVFKRLIDGAIPNKDLAAVTRLSLVAVVLALASALIGVIVRYLSSVVGEGVIAELRKALYEHIQRLPIAFFTRTQTGALMSRVNNDVVGAQAAYTFILRTVVADALVVVFTLLAMVRLSWRITLASLVAVPFLIWLSRSVGEKSQRAARKQMALNAEMNTVMTERFNVAGALLVKLFGRPKEEAQQFGRAADDVASIGVRRAMTGVAMMIALPMVAALGSALAYFWGARAVINGSMKLGTVVALATLVQRLYGPLTELASARVDFITAFVSFERVFEVLDAPVPIRESPSARVIPVGPGGARVEARNISFRYPAAADVSVASLETGPAQMVADPDALVLRDVSFVIEPGTMTALVGPSGAGKSTLSQLVARLYDVTGGAVLIDGVDVRDATFESLRDTIGVVTQDAHLFHDTIGANLRYARPSASPEDMIAAARAAQIHELLSSLPDGYDTMVGERGYRLSGGEKQRVALARVLLKNPRLVILDEATAHLDSETESQIQTALETALQGRTSLVIAHRLSTIQAADQILVIDDGRIVERGRHEELVAAGGLYAELYETQFLRGASAESVPA